MHQPAPSNHRNRLRMGCANQVAGGRAGVCASSGVDNFTWSNGDFHRVDCTAWVAPRRLRNI
eukprot:4911513-Pyramimonas_sp.AAC.1